MEKNTVNLSLQDYHKLKEAPEKYKKELVTLQASYERIEKDNVTIETHYDNYGRCYTHVVEEHHIINIMQKTINDLYKEREETRKLLNKRSWWSKVFK